MTGMVDIKIIAPRINGIFSEDMKANSAREKPNVIMNTMHRLIVHVSSLLMFNISTNVTPFRIQLDSTP